MDFPIVAVGASAGGLESISQLLAAASPISGIAFVIIQHMSADQSSSLAALLSRATSLKVLEIADGMLVRPNQVFVLPPNKDLLYAHPVFRLRSRDRREVQHLPIDRFMESLARQKRSRAIGVVLSGTGNDGTRGLQFIRQGGGTTLVQSEESAKFEGMPHSAIIAGVADFVLSPTRIAVKIEQLTRRQPTPAVRPVTETDAFRKIIEIIRSSTGTDFSLYRESSLTRRIRRRMAFSHSSTYRQYLAYLSSHDDEVRALRREILINVSSFFRDPSTFEILKRKILPKLLKDRSAENPLRLWVPGCATGEEVYSLAISILELIEPHMSGAQFVIFGTDLSEEALKKGHIGLYSKRDLRNVSSQRLKRFFVRTPNGFQIRRAVRERCLFVAHNLISDTPFSRMDLISCRNVLIYLSTALQNKVLPILHYAINPSGYLLLGRSENLANQGRLFAAVDRTHRIYKRRPVSNAAAIPLQPPRPQIHEPLSLSGLPFALPSSTPHLRPESVLLAHRGPAAVLVNADLEILQFNGQLAPYLEPASGQASLNLLKMARADLVWELRSAVLRARKSRRPVKSSGLHRESDGRVGELTFEVIPIPGSAPREMVFWVVFDPIVTAAAASSRRSSKSASSSRPRQITQARIIARLEHELSQTKSGLQEIIQQGESSNEELQLANEEILSRNEELQSINEEFETAKEELQSSNEELTTLNEELEHRHAELTVLTTDLTNLFFSLNIPILILGRDHIIRRFSQAAAAVFNLVPSDIGRSLGDLHFGALYGDVREQITSTIESAASSETQILGPGKRTYSIRIHPYRTSEGEIQGAILIFVDVHEIVVAGALAEDQRELAEAILATVGDSLVVLDADLCIVRANSLFLQTFHLSASEAAHASIFKVGDSVWDFLLFRKFLKEALAQKPEIIELEMDHVFPAVGRKKVHLIARPIIRRNGKRPLILLTMRDRTLLEGALNMSARLLRVQDDERRKVARELHDSTGQALTALKLNLNRIEKLVSRPSPDFAAVLEESRQLAESSIRELRTVSYLLHPPMLDHAGLLSAIRSFVGGFAKRGNIVAQAELPDSLPTLSKELELAVFRICQEALNNVYQHSESKIARVRLSVTSSKIILSVTDEGKGFAKGILSPEGIVLGGDGVGIPSMQERTRQLGGVLEINSTTAGSTIRATFPLNSK